MGKDPPACPQDAPCKVLIVVRGGVAYHVASGRVDVAVVDADDVDAGDPPPVLQHGWLPLVRRLFSRDRSKYVRFLP